MEQLSFIKQNEIILSSKVVDDTTTKKIKALFDYDPIGMGGVS